MSKVRYINPDPRFSNLLPALDLMHQMICYEPEARITAAQALEHPWLAAFYDPEEELYGMQPQDFTRWREIEALETVGQFRDAIWTEIQVGFQIH